MRRRLYEFLDKYKFFIILVLIICFWVVRLPLFNEKFGWHIWEDGNGLDTAIFVNQPLYPNYSLSGRINGKELYFPIVGHPLLPYEMFRLLGKFVNFFLPFENFSAEHTVLSIKIMVTSFQFLIYFLIGLQLFKRVENPLKKTLSFILLFLLTCAPISIYNSNEFQIDSFWGFLMIGLFFLAFINFLNYKKMFPGIFLLLSSAFVGFGKNEWSLMLIPSCIFILLLYVVIQKLMEKEKFDSFFIKTIVIVVVGNLVGNFINYLLDPQMYISGINLIVKMVTIGTMSGAPNTVSWFDVFVIRIPFISTCILLVFLILLFICQYRKKIDYYYLFLFIYSFSLFFAFFISSWGNYSRYFAPSLIGLIYVFLLYFTTYKINKTNIVAIIITMLITIFFGYKQIKEFHIQSKNSEYFSVVKDPSLNCIPLIDVGRVYKNKEIDFIHLSIGYSEAQKIADDFGKEVCR